MELLTALVRLERSPLKTLVKSEAFGALMKKTGRVRSLLKKLDLLRATLSLSKMNAGSEMVMTERAAETRAKKPNGTESRISGNSLDQRVLKMRPPTFPTLDTMESLAKAPAHFPFSSVSMIRRLSGVAEATETKEKIEYVAIVPAVVLSK